MLENVLGVPHLSSDVVFSPSKDVSDNIVGNAGLAFEIGPSHNFEKKLCKPRKKNVTVQKRKIPRPDNLVSPILDPKKDDSRSKRKAFDDDVVMEDVGTDCKKSKMSKNCDVEPFWK